jgi:hypothetical protein
VDNHTCNFRLDWHFMHNFKRFENRRQCRIAQQLPDLDPNPATRAVFGDWNGNVANSAGVDADPPAPLGSGAPCFGCTNPTNTVVVGPRIRASDSMALASFRLPAFSTAITRVCRFSPAFVNKYVCDEQHNAACHNHGRRRSRHDHGFQATNVLSSSKIIARTPSYRLPKNYENQSQV